MSDAAIAQRRLVLPQPRDDLLAVHGALYSRRGVPGDCPIVRTAKGGAISLHGGAIDAPRTRCPSIAVVLGFEGAGARQAEIVGLRGAERGELDAELVEMQGGHLLV